MVRSAGLVACIMGVAFWVACEKVQTVVPTPPTWRFQCPDYGGVHIALVSTDSLGHDSVHVAFDSIPLSGPIADIPEYHDCQRFIEGTQYHALFAIFAAFRLDTVGSPGVSRPMATIYSPDGSYPRLGIRPGFNCLFLTRGRRGEWTAKMIPWGAKENNCADPPGSRVGTDLAVRVENVGHNLTANDVPPVARWDRDKADSVYTIGIRCGGAWCSVGPKAGFAPSPGYTGPALSFDPIGGRTPTPLEEQRVQAIKGWYDVQRLAQSPENGGGPTAFRGFLIPHPFLDSLAWLNWKASATATLDAYYALDWIHVGYAVMEGDYKKWGLHKGKNKIYMCYGTQAKCLPEPPPTAAEQPSKWLLTACPADPTNTANRWWAKTVPETGPATYVCIQRMDHRVALMHWLDAHPGVEFSIPATARWRFLPVDESSWFGCPTGCCSKQ